jgi:hypothetical protein
VGHCGAKLDWLAQYAAELQAGQLAVRGVHVYSKCGHAVQPNVFALVGALGIELSNTTLPNVGREGQTFAHHMHSHYERLADLIVFLKDTTNPTSPQHRMRDTLTPVTDLLDQGRRAGFGCGSRPNSHARSMWHDRAEHQRFLFKYTKYTYSWSQKAAAASPHAGFASPTRGLGEWLAANGVLTGEALTDLQQRSLWPVCYGGYFAALSQAVHRHPASTWARLAAILSRGDNIEEGHYNERLWGAYLTPALLPQQTLQLRCAAGAVHRSGFPQSGILGPLLNCNCASNGTFLRVSPVR